MSHPEHKYTNNLIHETSPYLLQHAHNPVDWYPWGEEALDKAQNENKLIIVSIGYAACHWCHVMEQESFEDEKVAQLMNDNFVAIKVDREERPDIDQVYMNAVLLITGSGGWPLNCIALPDGRPIYGGTYFPKSQWIEMLKHVSNFVMENPNRAEHQAQLLTQGVQSSEMIYENTEKPEFTLNELNRIFTIWENNIDYTNGGQKGAPKFPLPIGYQFLLHYYYLTGNADALQSVTTTLNKMADGGIYDQIGGGFARYSTDSYWKVPHFEKMLYDNAQLVSLYSAGYQLTKDSKYKLIVSETLNFIQRELTSQEGGFYSSLDADSEGEEGKYYLWTKSELLKTLGNEADVIIDYYSVTENGNWLREQNILFKTLSDKQIADKYKITEDELTKRVLEAKQILLRERVKRVQPGLDNKIITSWNALMLKAYVDAYRIFDYKEYLDAALKNAEFLNTNIITPENRLYRCYNNGRASINAFIDDYSFTIDAFISLYQATFDEKWLLKALQLTDYSIAHFYDNNSGMFFYTSDIDPALIARKIDVTDNVIPSANSQMGKNLFILGQYFYNDDYIHHSKRMINNVKKNAFNGGAYYANWDILMTWFADDPYEVSILGVECDAMRKDFDKHYLPNTFLSGGIGEGTLPLLDNRLIEGQTTIYICQNRVCRFPVTDVNEALKQIIH
ncbi:MAG: thioredoxin domain-containing protein [Spirochaetota bacterium]|nr:thioredoxin domain-containing protein [Spirochaetota bacterium]